MKYTTNINMPAFYNTTEPTASVHGEIEPYISPIDRYESPVGGTCVLTAVFINDIDVLGDLSCYLIDLLEMHLYSTYENEQADNRYADTREEEF